MLEPIDSNDESNPSSRTRGCYRCSNHFRPFRAGDHVTKIIKMFNNNINNNINTNFYINVAAVITAAAAPAAAAVTVLLMNIF